MTPIFHITFVSKGKAAAWKYMRMFKKMIAVLIRNTNLYNKILH